jgi:tricorn protease
MVQVTAPLLLLQAPATTLAAADKPLLLQHPTLNRSHIAFVFGGDLWSVPREGGEARRLATSSPRWTNRRP